MLYVYHDLKLWLILEHIFDVFFCDLDLTTVIKFHIFVVHALPVLVNPLDPMEIIIKWLKVQSIFCEIYAPLFFYVTVFHTEKLSLHVTLISK